MSYESPNVILYDSAGNTLPAQSGSTITSGTPVIMSGGADPGNIARYLSVDTTGKLNIVGSVTTTDGTKATYSASIVGLVAAATTPTDIFTISGSATKTVRIVRFSFTATQATGAQRDVLVIKRSTANTGGTSTSPTNVPHDSNNAASGVSVKAYTANPTALGAAVGTLLSRKMFIAGSTAVSDEFTVELGVDNNQAIVLRGVNESLCFNLNSVASTTSSIDISVTWTEE